MPEPTQPRALWRRTPSPHLPRRWKQSHWRAGLDICAAVAVAVGVGVSWYAAHRVDVENAERNEVALVANSSTVFNIGLGGTKSAPGAGVGMRLTAINDGERPAIVTQARLLIDGREIGKTTPLTSGRGQLQGFAILDNRSPYDLGGRASLSSTLSPFPMVLKARSAQNIAIVLYGPDWHEADDGAEDPGERLLHSAIRDAVQVTPTNEFQWSLELKVEGRKSPVRTRLAWAVPNGSSGPSTGVSSAGIHVLTHGFGPQDHVWTAKVWDRRSPDPVRIVTRPVDPDEDILFPLSKLPDGAYAYVVEANGERISSGSFRMPCDVRCVQDDGDG